MLSILIKQTPDGRWWASADSPACGYAGWPGATAREAVQALRDFIRQYWPEERKKFDEQETDKGSIMDSPPLGEAWD